MATAPKWTERTIEAAGCKIHLSRAGKGAPIVVLHHDFGTPDQAELYDKLAQSNEVIVPHHAGWGKSSRPEWMRNVRDMAVLYQGILASEGIEKPTLLGLGFGGWVAAEMATMAPKGFAKLVLVAPFGIKPAEGYILDQAIVSYIDYPKAAFADAKAFEKVYGNVTTDQLEAWDIGREMSFRIAWKPYMYSQTLPHLLGAVKTPALIVWGDKDQHIPSSTASQWKAALPGSKVEIVKGAGHAVDLEKPAELAKLVKAFIG
jgi:pimeloyl-ACP methyl ester carboxylesterase